MGRPPISTMGLGLLTLSSEILVPYPPAGMTAFKNYNLSRLEWFLIINNGVWMINRLKSGFEFRYFRLHRCFNYVSYLLFIMSGDLSSVFGLVDGETVREYFLDNGFISCSVLDYGCILRTLNVPDRNGKLIDVVLGYDDIGRYTKFPGRMGSIIGRYANRVKDG